jgi:hypothetical protein
MASRRAIAVPPSVADDELFDLINLWATTQTFAPEELLFTEIKYGTRAAEYSRKRLLFERIFDEVARPGGKLELELDLAPRFAFTVYRDLLRELVDAPAKNPVGPKEVP